MAEVPGRCESCGRTVVPRGGVHIENSTNVTLGNIRHANGCPNCGGTVRFIEGRFNFQHGGVDLLAGPQWTADVLNELRLTLQAVVSDKPADPVAEVAKVSPELARALRVTTSGWDKGAVLALLSLLLAALMGAYTVAQDQSEDNGYTPREIRQIERILQDARQRGEPMPRTGRNEPCPCGSGAKYKRCHGRPHS